MRTAFILVWLALQVGLPLRYYLGSDRFDERFAWRMFSPVRMVTCQTRFFDTSGGGRVPVKLGADLHEVWAALIARARPSVIEAAGRRYCAAERSAGRTPSLHAEAVCTNPDTLGLTICHDASGDADGDGIPDGYRTSRACAGLTPRACFAAECGDRTPTACRLERCQVQAFPADEELCP